MTIDATKEAEINKGLILLMQYLRFLNPEKDWNIIYEITKDCKQKYGDWECDYHGIIDGEEYFFIFEKDRLLYAVNITGDSVLTAFWELAEVLSNKF